MVLTPIEILGVAFSGVLLLCLVTSCAAALRIRSLRASGYHDRLDLAGKGVQPDSPQGQKALPYFERDLDDSVASQPKATMYRSSVLRGLDGLLLDIAQLGNCMGVAFFSFLAPIMGVVILVASVVFVLRALWGGIYWVLSVVGGFLWSLLRAIAHALCQGCRRVCIDAQCHHLYSTSWCTTLCYSRTCSPACRICMRPWCEKLVEEGAWEVVLMRARDSNGRLPIPIKEDWVAARRGRVGKGGVQQKGVDLSSPATSPAPTSPSILTPTLNDRDGFVGSTVSIGGGRSGESKPLSPPAGSRRFLEHQGANAQRNAGSNPACGGAGMPASPVLTPSSPRRRPKRMGGRLAHGGDEGEHPALSMSSLALAALRTAWFGGDYIRPSAPPREDRVRRVVQSDGTVVEEEEVSDGEEEEGGVREVGRRGVERNGRGRGMGGVRRGGGGGGGDRSNSDPHSFTATAPQGGGPSSTTTTSALDPASAASTREQLPRNPASRHSTAPEDPLQ